MDNLEEMDKFLESTTFQNGTRKKQKILTDPSQAQKLTVIRNLPTNKNLVPDGFTAEFYQKLEKN